MISPLLILVGFLALYIELSHPGMASAGALSAVICFAIYFLGYFVAGLAGWEEIALFVFGLVLLAVEFFLFPGHFVSAALGTIAVLAALVLAMTGRLPSEPIVPTWGQVQIPLAKVFGARSAQCSAPALLARWLPKSTLFRKMELSAATSTAEGIHDQLGRSQGVARLRRASPKRICGHRARDVLAIGWWMS